MNPAFSEDRPDDFVSAHVIVPYLRETETFIYEKLTHFKRTRAAVVSNQTLDSAERFPLDRYYGMDLENVWECLWNKWKQRRGKPPPYFSEAIRRENARLIHAHFGPVGVWSLPLKEETGLPLVVGFYGIDAGDALLRKNPAMREGYARLFERADAIVALSEDMKGRLADMGCPEGKILIHRLAVDLTVFAPPESRVWTPGERVEILAVGRLVEKKGFAPLMGVFGELMASKRYNARLTVLGEGPERDAICRQIDRHNLYLHQSLPGAVRREQALAAMRRSHLFVAPSRTAANGDREGTPTVILEAQACGLPVLTSRHAGAVETVDPGRSALVVPEGDDDALRDGLAALLDDPGRWEEMGRAGRAFVEANHDIAKVCVQIEEDYFRIAGEPVPASDLSFGSNSRIL